MKKFSHIAAAVAAVAFVSLPADVVLAQNTPNNGSADTTTAPAPAVSETPATAPAATTPAPAATTPAPAAAAPAPVAATPAPAAATPATTSTEPVKGPKKKKVAKMTRQQEIDRSIDNGTVPSRYRNSVPKQYQQYIPFDKQ